VDDALTFGEYTTMAWKFSLLQLEIEAVKKQPMSEDVVERLKALALELERETREIKRFVS
jgi:hypothetical protein